MVSDAKEIYTRENAVMLAKETLKIVSAVQNLYVNNIQKLTTL
jgi:hypothetical protein